MSYGFFFFAGRRVSVDTTDAMSMDCTSHRFLFPVCVGSRERQPPERNNLFNRYCSRRVSAEKNFSNPLGISAAAA